MYEDMYVAFLRMFTTDVYMPNTKEAWIVLSAMARRGLVVACYGGGCEFPSVMYYKITARGIALRDSPHGIS